MSNQRYTPEFKDEAVRQVVERGYRVSVRKQQEFRDARTKSSHNSY